jgi:hypothetical protein
VNIYTLRVITEFLRERSDRQAGLRRISSYNYEHPRQPEYPKRIQHAKNQNLGIFFSDPLFIQITVCSFLCLLKQQTQQQSTASFLAQYGFQDVESEPRNAAIWI